MAIARTIVLFVILVAGAFADYTETVWSSVAFILHGERTPLYGEVSPSLTPYGAQQMLDQGSMFRARYLSANTTLSESENRVTSQSPIVGLSKHAIDNSELTILSSTDDWMVGSAMAFMQGLYPPADQSFATGAGGLESALRDGELYSFPLGGYQYPTIQTLSSLDQNSIWVQGHTSCPNYQVSQIRLQTDEVTRNMTETTDAFYQNVASSIFGGKYPSSSATFVDAYSFYDFASYAYHRDEEVREQLDPWKLRYMARLAALQQRESNANLSAYVKTPGDRIRAVSGRTMISQVYTLLKGAISYKGGQNRLNLAFTSLEPFIAFSALSGLIDGPSGSTFEPLPENGASMIFELFTEDNNTLSFPSPSDIWVRFIYRNGTDPEAPFQEYPLFGHGPSQSRMSLRDFGEQVERIGIRSVPEWCHICDAITLFCSAYNEGESENTPPTDDSQDSKVLPPVVAGVIGAIVTLVVLGLAVGAAALIGGLRVRRREPKTRNSTLGGFKGAEKMSSDADVAYAKGGARHERTGSWELRNGGNKLASSGAGPSVVTTADFTAQSSRMDDDTVSVLDHTPVKPWESV